MTPAAAELIRSLRGQHSPLMFHQSGGCCDGSSPMCYLEGEFRTGQSDVLLESLKIDGVDELVPVGKAYFGFTDEELKEIDRFVRRNTIERFGPVREVAHDAKTGLVMEVAFEGLQRSTRHKSGIAMRFPRISRLRWDKPPSEADRLETLEKMLAQSEHGRAPVLGK